MFIIEILTKFTGLINIMEYQQIKRWQRDFMTYRDKFKKSRLPSISLRYLIVVCTVIYLVLLTKLHGELDITTTTHSVK